MNIFIKPIIFLVLFSILHFGYDLTNWRFLTPFCGIDESIFQHLKMVFWSYLFTSIIEYLLIKKKIEKNSSFWYSRFLSTIILPWYVFLIWYLVPAIFGKTGSSTVELFWALISSYLSGLFAAITEKHNGKSEFDSASRIVIIVLLVASAFLYIKFTYQLPWIDMFVNPESF